MNNRRPIGLIIIAAIIMVVAGAFMFYQARHRTLNITTDVSALSFQLEDKTYTVNKELTLSPKPGIYKYRAVSVVDNKRVVLTNSVNLTDEKTINLDFNFDIYDDDTIKKVICETLSEDGSDNCINFSIVSVQFVENYEWAVVRINSPLVGEALAVLQVENGGWTVVDGPGTDIPTGGYFPASVERIIENEQ